MSQLSETFWITFTTMGFAFLTGSLAYVFKSKCNRVKCLGCLEIERDIEAELEDISPVPLPEASTPTTVGIVPERRLSAVSTRRDSFIDSRVAEAVRRYQSIHALTEPSRNVTRSNSFT